MHSDDESDTTVDGAAVAAHLGDQWTYEPPTDRQSGPCLLAHPTGRRVLLTPHHRDPARVIANGLAPGSSTAWPHWPEITVRISRGPHVLAREIGRRLLPAYIAQFQRYQAALEDQERADAARRDIAEHIARRLPGSTIADPGWGGVRIYWRPGSGVEPSVTVEFSGAEGAVTMNIRWMALAAAEQVADALCAAYRPDFSSDSSNRA